MPLTTCETVETETPAVRATSEMVVIADAMTTSTSDARFRAFLHRGFLPDQPPLRPAAVIASNAIDGETFAQSFFLRLDERRGLVGYSRLHIAVPCDDDQLRLPSTFPRCSSGSGHEQTRLLRGVVRHPSAREMRVRRAVS